MQRFLPPLRIHSWGGLGSQLFAIALAEELKVIFPKRSFKIVLHTGGVTRRLPEIVGLFPNFDYLYEDDFQSNVNAPQDLSKRKNIDFRKSIKFLLSFLGFLAECNDDGSTKKLLPWVFSIRGHYSYRTIDSNFLKGLYEIFQSFDSSNVSNIKQACVVHYRLGDLLTLTEKNPISAQSIKLEYARIHSQMNFSKLVFFSDSPSEVGERFSSPLLGEVVILDLSVILVIANSIHAKYFIGTSSKISFWIAGIRAVTIENPSSLPAANVKQYEKLAAGSLNLISPYFTHSQ